MSEEQPDTGSAVGAAEAGSSSFSSVCEGAVAEAAPSEKKKKKRKRTKLAEKGSHLLKTFSEVTPEIRATVQTLSVNGLIATMRIANSPKATIAERISAGRVCLAVATELNLLGNRDKGEKGALAGGGKHLHLHFEQIQKMTDDELRIYIEQGQRALSAGSAGREVVSSGDSGADAAGSLVSDSGRSALLAAPLD